MRAKREWSRRLRWTTAACLVALAAAGAAAAQDWNAVAEPDVVRVVTQDPDGSTRETKVWIVAVDGRAYIRTGGTRWYRNIERDPHVVLRTGADELPLTTALVTDAARVERVVAAFREKYGRSDAFMELFRFGEPHVMQLAPRR